MTLNEFKGNGIEGIQRQLKKKLNNNKNNQYP